MVKMDRKLIASSQAYEVSYFARKHGITLEKAREILKKAGPSRDKANAMAGGK
jgi:hypothetical protein